MTFTRRASDRVTVGSVVLTLVGLAIIGAGVWLKVHSDASDMLVGLLIVSGGVIIPGNHLIGAVRAWRKP